MSSENPSEAVRRQIEAIEIDSSRPLLITDADEVLLQFVRSLEDHLLSNELYLDLTSFALTGNIKRRADDQALPSPEVKLILANFFEERTEMVAPVEGAADALKALSERAQIVVLSNIPPHLAEARRRGLARHGKDYPVIANTGLKGPPVRHLARAVAPAATFFMDDIPGNHDSVAASANEVIRLHFVADPRLARLVNTAATAHTRIDDWPGARAYIERHLDEVGKTG